MPFKNHSRHAGLGPWKLGETTQKDQKKPTSAGQELSIAGARCETLSLVSQGYL